METVIGAVVGIVFFAGAGTLLGGIVQCKIKKHRRGWDRWS